MVVFSAASYSFWQKNIHVTRVIAIFNACLMFTYDIFLLSYIGMVSESLTFITVFVAVVKSKPLKW